MEAHDFEETASERAPNNVSDLAIRSGLLKIGVGLSRPTISVETAGRSPSILMLFCASWWWVGAREEAKDGGREGEGGGAANLGPLSSPSALGRLRSRLHPLAFLLVSC